MKFTPEPNRNSLRICENYTKENGCCTQGRKRLCPMAQMRIKQPQEVRYGWLAEEPYCFAYNLPLDQAYSLGNLLPPRQWRQPDN